MQSKFYVSTHYVDTVGTEKKEKVPSKARKTEKWEHVLQFSPIFVFVVLSEDPISQENFMRKSNLDSKIFKFEIK